MNIKQKSMYGLLLCVLILSVVGCSSFSFPENFFGKRYKAWKTEELRVQQNWSEEEKKIPFFISQQPAELPVRYQIKNLPPVRDQGSKPRDTLFAVGYLATTHLFGQKEKSYRCSPAFLYNELEDQEKERGVEIVRVLKLLKTKGCANDNRRSNRSEADYLIKTTNEDIKDGKAHRIRGAARIDWRDFSQVESVLVQDIPIILTLQVSENFIPFNKTIWTPAGRSAGRQSMVLTGYDRKKSLFILRNSVGEKWGMQGDVMIPYRWFILLVDRAYILL